MRLDFVKMHGLGNDFLVLDLPADAPLPSPSQWRALADRRTGIGFDQALVLQPPRRAGTDALYRVFNADGGEVEMCGNGARCAAALLHQRRVRASGKSRADDATLTLDSAAGLLRARILADGAVTVNMGVPDFSPRSLPFDSPARASSYSLEAAGVRIEFGAVSIGNPHAVLRVADVATAPVAQIGRALQSDPHFPHRINVGFMQVLDPSAIRLRVFERGVGETLACGSGACAAVAVGRDLGLLGADVQVHVPGGTLSVHWDGEGEAVWLTGPAHQSFEGQVEI
jgi:diaminopimelate epimerase